MTLHVYDCETVTIRSEMVKRTKSEGIFYGLRLHMNTDQAVTFWSRSQERLMMMVEDLATTLLETPSERVTVPGQLSQ